MFTKIVKHISNGIQYLFHLELEKEERQYRFIAQIIINNQSFYFGPFYTEEQLTNWKFQNDINHLICVIHEICHPNLHRNEWPI